MGYAKLNQKGCGIHLRQFARAFIFDDGDTRVVYVSADACMVSHGFRNAVSITHLLEDNISVLTRFKYFKCNFKYN